MRRLFVRFVCWVFVLSCLPSSILAIEIATGSMLGPRYDPDRFYVRSRRGGDWEETYRHGPFRRAVRGKLIGVDLGSAWLTADQAHVETSLDRLERCGAGSFSIQLQNEAPTAKGPAAGGDLYRSDGSLDPQRLERLGRLLEEADERGLIAVVTLFRWERDEIFDSSEAIVVAARNVARWLIAENRRNVILDLARSWDSEEAGWDFGQFISRNVAALIQDVRERFNEAAFSLPIGAASASAYPQPLARLTDVVLVDAGSLGAASTVRYDRPVWALQSAPKECDLAAAPLAQSAGWTWVAPGSLAGGLFDDEPSACGQTLLDSIAAVALKKPPQP